MITVPVMSLIGTGRAGNTRNTRNAGNTGRAASTGDFGTTGTIRANVEPASLEGYGPIDLCTARQLTSEGPSLIRLHSHLELTHRTPIPGASGNDARDHLRNLPAG